MKIDSINNFGISLFNENIKILPTLSAQTKKIITIAFLAFCCLSALYLFCKFLFSEGEKSEIKFKLDDLGNLENKLAKKILGQPYAIKVTVEALIRHAAGLRKAKSPIGTFLYVGPTGVGKTQLAKELAIELLGSEHHIIRIDMNQFREDHSLTRLIGSLPGYKQHEAGGQLTEALKKTPHSIVLLDEVDKAHPSILKVFLQAFDEGYIRDAQGVVVDCTNTIFILTSNHDAETILSLKEEGYSEEEILPLIKEGIIQSISPELYNRLDVAPFMGLGDDLLDQLIENLLNVLKKDILERKEIKIAFDPTVVQYIKSNGYDYNLGARPLNRFLENNVTTPIAKEVITSNIKAGDSVMIYYQNDKIVIEKVKQDSV